MLTMKKVRAGFANRTTITPAKGTSFFAAQTKASTPRRFVSAVHALAVVGAYEAGRNSKV